MKFKEFLFPRFDFGRLSTALLVLRILAGLAMMFHGWGKIQNPFAWQGPDSATPAIFQFLAALSEFGGGFAWILGLLTPLASLGIASTMAVAMYTHSVLRGDPFVGQGGSYELGALYWAVAALLMVVGPGRISLDHLIQRKRK